MLRPLLSVVFPLAWALPLAAQVPTQLPFPTPLQASDGVDGSPGLWAAGATYKASFHDGFVFYPVLGSEFPCNLPWRWRTAAVKLGTHQFALQRSAPEFNGTRCSYELAPGLVESYELHAEGVEQTFWLQQRPAAEGDLVVLGELLTELVCAPLAAAHQPLRFAAADGQPVLDYGAAVAIDAAGNRWLMTTSCQGNKVELRLPAAAVAAAVFPLLVDPLTTTVPVDAGGPGAGALSDLAVGRSNHGARPLMAVWSRASSATDRDLFAVLGSDSHQNQVVAFQDLDARWSTSGGEVAYVGAANRWLLAFERDFGSNAAVRCVVVDRNATAPVSAVTAVGHPQGRASSRRPALGGTLPGSTAGTAALLVHESDVGGLDGDHTEVYARSIDLSAASPVLGNAFIMGSPVGSRYDRHHATVTPESAGGSASWLVAWQELDRNLAAGTWRIALHRVQPNGSRFGPAYAPAPQLQHALRPQVTGIGGNYIVAWTQRTTAGNAAGASTGHLLSAARVLWSDQQVNPSFGPLRTLASGSGNHSLRLCGAATDYESASHHAFVFEQQNPFNPPSVGIVRTGGTGLVVESAELYRNSSRPGYAPAVCFDPVRDEFDTVFVVETPSSGVYARSLGYPGAAQAILYGVGCGGTIASSHVPRVGDLGYAVRLSGAAPHQGAIAALSLSRASMPLDLTGMPGCSLLVGTDPGHFLGNWFTVVRSDGSAAMPIPLPEREGFAVDFMLQWFWLDPSAAGLGLRATRGIEARVR